MRRANASTFLSRRITPTSSKFTATTTATTLNLANTTTPAQTISTRNYCGPLDPWWSLWCMTWVICTGAAWGNNIASLNKYGLFRHNMQIDNPYFVEGSRVHQFIGGFIGFLFYWNIVGPMKYWHSDMEKWAKRFGPF